MAVASFTKDELPNKTPQSAKNVSNAGAGHEITTASSSQLG